jgi:hypothetical protein
MFLSGRLRCGITITLAMATILLPCRASLLEVMLIFHSSHDAVPLDQEFPRISKKCSAPIKTKTENPYMHYSTTFGIVTTCYAPGVWWQNNHLGC